MDADIASPGHKARFLPVLFPPPCRCPVHRVTLPGRQAAWLITRYDDVAAALEDERLVKTSRPP
ncbi:MAG: hypothetical protein WKF75_02005 [Singulisphaera sp.]